MIQRSLRIASCAGILAWAGLLASTAAFSQQAVRTTGSATSIVSLAPSPHPVGVFLARRAGDATFEKTPGNYHVFAAAGVGEDATVEALTINFDGETTLKGIKTSNKDFVILSGGSCYEGNHYSRGQSCTLVVRFKPQGPGHRLGFVQITHSAEAAVTTLGLLGNGYAPTLSFIPSLITTVPGTYVSGVGKISNSTNLAVDGGDILYVADVGNNLIREIDSSGVINNLTPAFATPQSLAVDSSGFIYSANVPASTYYFSFYAPWGTQSAYGYTHTVGTCTPSTPCSIATVGMSKPANMSIDPYDNLFFEEATKGAAEMPVAGLAAGSGGLNLWYLTNQFVYSSGSPASFAVDRNDNIYNFYNWGTSVCYLQVESAYAAEYAPTARRVAGGAACGFSGDGGQATGAEISSKIGQIAFDVAGNLYFADAGNQRVRRIDAITGIIRTIAGTGTAGYSGDGAYATHATLANPTGVTVDSQGQVYIISGAATTGTAQVIRKIGTTGRQYFASTAVGKTSASVVVVVSNTGNSTLTLANTTWSGPNVADFKIDPNLTTCILAPLSSLAAGQTCQIGFSFKPLAVGTRSAYFNFQSNTASGINQILISGTALAAAAVNFTAPLTSSLLSANTALALKVSVSSAYKVPTGTVTFKVDGVQVGSPVTLVSGAASLSLSGLASGSHSLLALYSGDKYTAAARASETVSVTGAAAARASQAVSVRAAAKTN